MVAVVVVDVKVLPLPNPARWAFVLAGKAGLLEGRRQLRIIRSIVIGGVSAGVHQNHVPSRAESRDTQKLRC